MSDERVSAPLSVRRGSAGILISVLALAAGAWLITAAQMSGTDMGAMGTGTELGSAGHFLPLWITMMAAMMLPGTSVVLFLHPLSDHESRAVPAFLLSYLAIWAAVGTIAYAAYRPHGTVAAGAIVIAAGLYEFTPLERHCRRQCQQQVHSGLGYGIVCIGSSIGLMAILLAISPMSIGWMAVITAVIVAKRLLPTSWSIDISVALAVLGLGVWILAHPTGVPGLVPPM